MAIIAEDFEFVVGVDTHARTHAFTTVHSATGALVDTAAFPTTSAGIDRAIAWIRRRTGGETVFAAVEGTSSYGARLTQALLAAGIEVGEVRPPARSSRALTGKSDPVDAEAAARSVLGRQRDQVIEPRAAGTRTALRILLSTRSLLDHQRTANRNALTALLRGPDLGIDARKPLRDAQITAITAWRTTNTTDTVIRIARTEAKRLVTAIHDQTRQLRENHKALAQLAEQLAPGQQEIPGLGPVTAAIIICAYSHRGRIRSEAAFAALGGVAPRPASSGNTTRHRLNRSGDRQLNRAFDVIVRTRMRFDARTKDYVARSRATGKPTAKSAAASSATSAAQSSANSKPSWLDTPHRRVILGAAPGRRTPRPGAGSRSPARQPDAFPRLAKFGRFLLRHAGADTVLDLGLLQPVMQGRLGDPEVLGDLRQRGLVLPGHGNDIAAELGRVGLGPRNILPARNESSQVRSQSNRGQSPIFRGRVAGCFPLGRAVFDKRPQTVLQPAAGCDVSGHEKLPICGQPGARGRPRDVRAHGHQKCPRAVSPNSLGWGRKPPNSLGPATAVQRPRSKARTGKSAHSNGPYRPRCPRIQGLVLISVATLGPRTGDKAAVGTPDAGFSVQIGNPGLRLEGGLPTGGQTSTLLAAHGQSWWPSMGNPLTACGQFPMAAGVSV